MVYLNYFVFLVHFFWVQEESENCPEKNVDLFLKKNSLSALGHLYYFTSCFQPQSDPVPAYNDVEQANIYPLFQHKVHKKSVTSNRNAAFYFQIRCKQSPEQHLWTPMVSILLSIIVCTFKQKSIIKSENSKQIFYDYKQRKK